MCTVKELRNYLELLDDDMQVEILCSNLENSSYIPLDLNESVYLNGTMNSGILEIGQVK
ncbi:hypothetical protein [Clostridium sp.]|uniref:hypothetical protein n=1 Tax=Clostridium sp. TaxID=1506 RepID=UPI00261733CF|nr:hypothetical protein [Clostridium sp.]